MAQTITISIDACEVWDETDRAAARDGLHVRVLADGVLRW